MTFHQPSTPSPPAALTSAEHIAPAAPRVTTREIPYDYVARFLLTGRAGNRVQDVINVSTDGAFVAVAIGYGFLPDPQSAAAGLASLRPIGTGTLADLASVVAALTNPPTPLIERDEFAACLALRFCGIQFKYAIVDSGSGRELQNQPIHSIAGLGEATGERPFRNLAKPMLYMPRSTIRIEVQEVSSGRLYANGELFIAFHGYKVLNYGTTTP